MSVQLDDVPWDLQEMVNIIGMENFLKVCKFYGVGVCMFLFIRIC